MGRDKMASKENLFKDIYYDMKVKNILSNTDEVQDSYTASVVVNKINNKSKLRLQFLYNGLLILAVVLIFIFLTNAWFVDNEVVEAEQMNHRVYKSVIPVFTNMNFNDADCDEYDNTEIALKKAIIPGDVIDLSVFVELAELENLETVEITIQDVPEWLDLIDKSKTAAFANKIPVMIEGEWMRVTLERFPNKSEGIVITSVAFTDSTIVFTVDVPNNYASYDGVCLDFSLYFEDSGDKQNDYMNEPVRMRFTASMI